MGYEIDNFCVGCPQGCIHCGRDRDIRVYYCDDCGENADDDTPLYDWNGQELCFDCVKESLNAKELDDMDDSLCENGCETDVLYEFEGKWLCRDCLKEILDDDYKIYFDD